MSIETEGPGVRGKAAEPPSEEYQLPLLLIVDDSEFERRCIARILRDFDGLRLIDADDGAAALELVERDRPDLVLTDLVMPGLDGLELVRQAREMRPGMPIILMTAYGGEEEAVRALRAGAADYLPKSRMERDLPRTLRRALDVLTVDRRRQRLARRLRSRTSHFDLENDPELAWTFAQAMAEDVAAFGALEHAAQVRLHVALQEAMANALYHGNLEVDSALRQDDENVFYALAEERRRQEPYRSRRIQIRSRIDRRAAVFEISDEGPGFDPALINRSIELEDLGRVGGRGLLLIRTFMDEVGYDPKSNVLTLVKRLGPDRAPS